MAIYEKLSYCFARKARQTLISFKMYYTLLLLFQVHAVNELLLFSRMDKGRNEVGKQAFSNKFRNIIFCLRSKIERQECYIEVRSKTFSTKTLTSYFFLYVHIYTKE